MPAAAPAPGVILDRVTAGRDIIIQLFGPAKPDDRADLLVLLENVRQVWIERVLERSLHAAARLELGKETRADAVANPWATVIELPDQTRRPLSAGQTMADFFDEVGRALLILGRAGSGKTISLLELARDLGDRAKTDDRLPIPVVFNLSTWTRQTTLFDWLVEELKRYFVPAWQGAAWLKGCRLVLLLDGLDEVRPEARADCIRAINDYATETGSGGLVVCSRLEEYTALGVLFKLRGAVCLQPLTREQVEQYLVTAGAPLAALRVAWQSDSQLQTLAETPLMLSVMSLAYRDLPVEALSGQALDSVEERREHLFTTYVQRVFARRGKRPSPYPQECVLFWLTWLARQMRQRAESVFLIERLQPDWLSTRAERYVYTAGSRLLGGAALGLILGSILDLAMGLIGGAAVGLGHEIEDFAARVMLGLVLGLVSGLVAGVSDAWRFERSRRLGETRSRRTARQVIQDVAGYVLAMGLLGWLLVARIGGWDDPETGLVLGLLVGLLFGLFFGLHDSRRGASEDIRTVEALRWSWADARDSGGRGALAGLTLGLILGLIGALVGGSVASGKEVGWADRVIFAALVGAIGGVLGVLLGVAFGGLQSSIVPTKASPNQGIELSFRNAVLGGVVTGGQVGLLLGAISSLFLGSREGLNAGLVGGIFFGLLAGLWDGGLDVIQHYTLRLTLAARGYAPLDCARFLDHAVALVLLQRAGGGYLFVHRLLLEHFADLTPAASLRSSCVRAGLAVDLGRSE